MKQQYLSPCYNPETISFRAAQTKLIKGAVNHLVEKLQLPLLPVMEKRSFGAYPHYGILGRKKLWAERVNHLDICRIKRVHMWTFIIENS
jgi:hypothetical protein